MFSLTSSIDQYATVPLTFSDSNGARVLPSGAVTANVTAGDGASAKIIETPGADGVLEFAVQLVTGPTAGVYKFSVTDTDTADAVIINTLEFEYTSVANLSVDIIPGTPVFAAKSELPPV